MAIALAALAAGCGADESDRTNHEGFAVGAGSGGSGSGGTDTVSGTATDTQSDDCIEATTYTGALDLKWGLPSTTPASGDCTTAGDGAIVNDAICAGGVELLSIARESTAKGGKIEANWAAFASYKVGGIQGYFALSVLAVAGDARMPKGSLWLDGGCGSHDRTIDGVFAYPDGTEHVKGNQSLCPAGDVFFAQVSSQDRIKVTLNGEVICGAMSSLL